MNEKAAKENLYVSISGSLLHTQTLSLHNTDRHNNFVFIYLLEEGDVVHQCVMFTENTTVFQLSGFGYTIALGKHDNELN